MHSLTTLLVVTVLHAAAMPTRIAAQAATRAPDRVRGSDFNTFAPYIAADGNALIIGLPATGAHSSRPPWPPVARSSVCPLRHVHCGLCRKPLCMSCNADRAY